jgi:RHS repeat-associated protein
VAVKMPGLPAQTTGAAGAGARWCRLAIRGAAATTESTASWNGAQDLATYDNSSADMTAADYNGNGLRTSTTITPAGGSAVTQNYVWNTTGPTPQIIMDGTNAYIYASGVAPSEQVNLTTGSVAYLVVDGVGSVRGIVNSSGSLTATTSYDAWGNPDTVGGLTASTPFGFAGGYTDPDGLIYLLNRYYKPSTGQFTSVDPDLSQTLAPYAYTDGDPVSNIDPTGKDYEGIWGPAGLFWANFYYTRSRYTVEFGWRLTGDRYAWFGGYIDVAYSSNNDFTVTGGPIWAAGDSSVVQYDILPGWFQGRYAVDLIEAECGGWRLHWGFLWVPFYAVSAVIFGYAFR